MVKTFALETLDLFIYLEKCFDVGKFLDVASKIYRYFLCLLYFYIC